MRRALIMVHGGAGRRAPELESAMRDGARRAAAAGRAMLDSGGSAVDAVLAAVAAMEDDPLFNAGVGSCLTADGRVEMDASMMDGVSVNGAGVALVTCVRNPVRLAHLVWRDGRHVLLAGAGAETFARSAGLACVEPQALITERQRARWAAFANGAQPPDDSGGTVGAVAIDRDGHVAAATSTGGLLGKLPGRIGDSAVLGAGTYADDRAGAASATGHGESILLSGLARRAVDWLRDGRDPAAVANAVIRDLARRGAAAVGGIIVVDRFGRCGWAHNAEHMTYAPG